MSTPFPGVDPYLEQHGLWERVHVRLIVAIADALSPLVSPRYWVDVEQRAYLAVLQPDEFVGKPDVLIGDSLKGGKNIGAGGVLIAAPAGERLPIVGEIPMPEEVVERFLEVRDVINDEIVTVIELLSPTNKSTREGRAAYLEKRQKILRSQTNLIEIDLIRSGQPIPLRMTEATSHLYRIVISRSQQRPRADIYPFGLREPIPNFPVPLRPGEIEPVIDLNRLLHELYERVGYDRIIDYRQNLSPRLAREEMKWVDTLLRRQGFRG